MKAIHLIRTFLLLALVATVSVRCSCDDTTAKPKTLSQLIATGLSWKVVAARNNGAVQPQASYANFRVTFSVNGTYQITRGGAPYSPSRVASQQGSWALATTTSTTAGDLTFDAANAAVTRKIKLSNVKENATATIEWTLEESEDKTKPTISFDLVPAN
jgi:hypothetical protein